MDILRPPFDLVLEAWAKRVRGNREQVDRLREVPDGADFYAPVAQAFRADPRRTDEPALDTLLSLVGPDDVVLDIGAGGGRYALPLALAVGQVIALDPSPGMLGVLRDGMNEHSIANIRTIEARWPVANAPRVTVALMAHVGYDIEEIGPFIAAMEATASRLCLALVMWRQPTAQVDDLWPEVHGEPRVALPAGPELALLFASRGLPFEIRLAGTVQRSYESVDHALDFARRQTWVRPGSAKDERLQAALRARLHEENGRFVYSAEPVPLALFSWAGGHSRIRTDN